MKINVTVDCTPEEARAFFGLPDVKPLQEAVLAELQAGMKRGMTAMEPADMMNTVLRQYMGGIEQAQQFFGALAGAAASSGKKKG
ncbi:MAG TPA: DUF6489 family protein [Stellaceae bacterium]|jgi:hypothetical protein